MLRGFLNAVSTFYLKNDFESLNYLIFSLIYFIATVVNYSLEPLHDWESNIAAIITIKAISSNAQLYCFSFLVYSAMLGIVTFCYTNARYLGKSFDEKVKYILHTIILLIIMFLNLSVYQRAKNLDMESALFFAYNIVFGFVYSLLVTKSLEQENISYSLLMKAAYTVIGTITMQALPLLLRALSLFIEI